jgi:hypothetical protein
VWSCEPSEEEDEVPLAPEEVDPDTAIRDLTDSERSAVCEWIQIQEDRGVGFAPRDNAPVEADGLTNGGCQFGHQFQDTLARPTVSPGQCAANLALSSCNASVAELADCVIATTGGGIIHARSCGPYLEKTGCNGTVLWAYNECEGEAIDPGCRLQVE